MFLFKNVSIKFKTLKSDITFVFYCVFGKVSFSAFRNQRRYTTLDPGLFEEWTKYDRGTKNKKQTCSKTSEELCCQSNQWPDI